MPLLNPIKVIAPHRITKPEQVVELSTSMKMLGWVGEPLIGYVCGGAIQLLSGTHRRAAAFQAGIKIPVKIYPKSHVEAVWGDIEKWKKLMQEDYHA